MKTKLIYLLLGILLITNSVMLFMLIKKPHQNRPAFNPGNFIIQKLNFNSKQKEQFLKLDEAHRAKMVFYDTEIRKLKENMFKDLSGSEDVDLTLTQNIGELLAKKENEVFYFFKSIKNISDKEQLKALETIIERAIMHSGGREGNGAPPPPRGIHGKLPSGPPR